MLFHELGHLQPAGYYNEVGSELNMFETNLMAFVVFINQNNDTSDPERWASFVNEGGISSIMWAQLETPILYINFGLGTAADLNIYNWSNIFILNRLLSSGGNFSSVRDEISRLIDSHNLEAEIWRSVDEFTAYYSPDNYGGHFPLEDTHLSLRLAFFQELERRFGQETALAFFEANSHASHLDGTSVNFGSEARHVRRIYTFTPDDLNCVFTSVPLRRPDGPCEESDERCNFLAGPIVSDFAEATPFCCLSIEANDDGTFEAHKWLMRADYRIFYNLSRNELWFRDNRWEAIEYLDPVETIEIGINERCTWL